MSTERRPARKVILFEMNEVPWRVLDDYARRHPRGPLAAILARSKQLDTICEDQVELDPWTSWPTLHRGVIDEEHGVRHLGQSLDAADRRFPPIWQLLAREGCSVGVFGSLHSSHLPRELDTYAFYVPDFFSDESHVHPAELAPFQRFNLLMTRRSARNVDAGIPLRPALDFLRQYVGSGLNWKSTGILAAAIAGERLHRCRKTRRRSLQALVGLDMFLPLVSRTAPQFATFYTNHVAANMHRFWAAGFPHDLADNPMPEDWRRTYAGEIEYAMRILEGMLERLRVLAEQRDYLLLATSSIGQSGVPATRIAGFTTITDLARFMTALGVANGKWRQKPAMVPCLSIEVDPAEAARFEAALASLSIGMHRVRKAEREGSEPFTYDRAGDGFHLFVYFEELDLGRLAASLGGRRLPAAELGLGFFPHDEEVGCSGRHTPFGALFVYDPRRPATPGERVAMSTLQIAPALLGHFGIAAPPYMSACDPQLFDVSKPGTAVPLRFRGGGVETPVTRADELLQHA
jgi:hypothetical protein